MGRTHVRVGNSPRSDVSDRAVSVTYSPFLTGKNKRVGMSSARLIPAARRGTASCDEAWRGEAGGGGGVREGTFSSHSPIACGRETLIKGSKLSSTSGVGLNSHHLVMPPPTWALEDFSEIL